MKPIHSWTLDAALVCCTLGLASIIFGGPPLLLAGGILILFGLGLLCLLLGVEP